MIKSFGAKNFMGFKEWLQIDCALPAKVTSSTNQNYPYSSVICFMGANASGKSNAIKALLFLSEFATNSFRNKPDDKIEVSSHFDNNEPIEFYIEFKIDNTLFSYELSLNKTEVLVEKIYRKEKRKTLIFSRSKDKIAKSTFSGNLTNVKLRTNASFISTYYQHEVVEIKPIYGFFHEFFSNLDHDGQLSIKNNHSGLHKFYFDNKKYLEFTKTNLMKFDTGIVDVKIERVEKDEVEHYFPLFKHENGLKTGLLLHREESSGTISLYRNLVYYKAALEYGGTLILDELDLNLHPDIIPHLITLFLDPTSNTKNAQIIFSSHSSGVIDLVGKYRTYLFAKTLGECIGYRLDEINPELIRNDRLIEPLYKAGKIGGVPEIK